MPSKLVPKSLVASGGMRGYVRGYRHCELGVSVPLTDTAIRKAKGRDKQYKLGDAGGLYLLVKPDRAKYWRLKYRHAGKEKLLAFGVYPQVTLADARADRDDAKRLLKQGTDPVIFRKQQRQTAELAAANNLQEIFCTVTSICFANGSPWIFDHPSSSPAALVVTYVKKRMAQGTSDDSCIVRKYHRPIKSSLSCDTRCVC